MGPPYGKGFRDIRLPGVAEPIGRLEPIESSEHSLKFGAICYNPNRKVPNSKARCNRMRCWNTGHEDPTMVELVLTRWLVRGTQIGPLALREGISEQDYHKTRVHRE